MKTLAILIAESCSLWLSFILVAPARWKRITEIENAFWVRHGIFSEKFAEECKKVEQGRLFKTLLFLVAFLGLLSLTIR